jgi:RND superfamily putative drug exporter
MVFAIWLPLLVGFYSVNQALGENFHTDYTQPDSESRQVKDAFSRAGDKTQDGQPAEIVFRYPLGTGDPQVKTAMMSFFADVEKFDGVKVISPYDIAGRGFNSPALPISFASISVTDRSQSEFTKLGEEIKARGDQIQIRRLTIEYGGSMFVEVNFPPTTLLALLAAMVVLLLAFGSVLAMGLPITTATFGLGVGTALIGLASHRASTPDFAPEIAQMIGLGVGIDYALFIVSRYRDGRKEGLDSESATVAALDTSGRAVLFAGIIVVISLLGLLTMRLPFVDGLAIATSLAVLMMMLASLTLLPALLGFFGHKIDRTSLAAAIATVGFIVISLVGILIGMVLLSLGVGLLFAAGVMVAGYLPFGHRLRRPLEHRQPKPREQRLGYRWSRVVLRRPWQAAAGATLVLVVLALPLLSIQMGFTDPGVLKTDQTTRRAFDLITNGFAPGFNGPLAIITTDPAVTPNQARQVDHVLTADPGIVLALPGVHVDADHDDHGAPAMWKWIVFPRTAPQEAGTRELVNRLRGPELDRFGYDLKVGGFTAGSIDFSTYIVDRMPILIGAVLILSFLLLMVVFRSILVPLKAVIMNLLSIGASYGVTVAIFQWGWAKGFFDIGKTGPIEPWIPMMLFAIVFGLSMDYEVFLLSRMKEEFERTGDNATAVVDGLASTARVITAAAVIMFCVFSTFVLGDDRLLKLFGLGLAVAVLVDATLVRLVLVPATMELLGDRNWWMPKWLDRILPRVHVEGHQQPLPEVEAQSVLV